MSMLLPDALSPTSRGVGLAMSFALILWGLTAAGWHLSGEGHLTWRSGLFGSPFLPFNAVRDIAAKNGIVFERYGANQNLDHNLEGALKDAAANGKLAVWGRPYQGPVRDHDPLIPIPKEHFFAYSFRHGALAQELPNDRTHTARLPLIIKGVEEAERETFYDLHVSERQARAVLRAFARKHRA